MKFFRRREKQRNYFLTLAGEQKNKIQEAGVEFCDLDIDGHAGVVVDEENLLLVLQVLGMGMVVATETKTSLEGIVKVELVSGVSQSVTEPKGEVEVESWNGREQSNFVKIVEEILLPFVGTDIILSVPHGERSNPTFDGRFHIRIWSGLGQKNGSNAPKKIWGIGVDCQDAGFTPIGQGVSIVDIETGWAVAELVGSNLYIFHDICHDGTSSELAIFRRLLEEVVMELSVTPEEKAERQRKLAEEKKIRSRKQYIVECSKRFEKTVKGTKQKIELGHREIEELQKKLTRKIREVRGAERKLEQLNAAKDGQLESYGREFDSLSAVPGVEDVQVSDGVIKVFTEHIYITPDGHEDTYDIGKFRMEIYTSGANGGIRFFNITRKGKGDGYNIHHPHVDQSGFPCLGNISELVSQLIGEYEYSAVAQLGLQYLKSVNLNDSVGKGIFKYWPKKEEK